MAEVPPEADAERQLAAIQAADEAVTKARNEAAAGDTELAAAEKSRAALVAEEQEAWAALAAARDKLVSLGAPPVGVGGQISQQRGVPWSAGPARSGTSARASCPELGAAVAGLQQRCAESSDALTQLLADHGVAVGDPLSGAPAAVAEQRVRAEALAADDSRRPQEGGRAG